MSAENENKISEKADYSIDFITSSAVSKIGYKFLVLYIPILWISGYMAVTVFFDMSRLLNNWIITTLLLPIWLFVLYYIFTFGLAVFTKALLVIVNMVHKPKEGIFRAEEGNSDYEFWRLRIELKKLALWFMSQSPLPWYIMFGFRWFGVRIDFSSHLQDAWVDTDFIEFGRKVTVGQAAVVMSSMVVGNYLIIRKVIFDDYTVIGGVSNTAPGTIVGKDSVTGAFSNTNLDQVLEEGWIYLGLPAKKFKPNKYAEERRDVIYKRDVASETKYQESRDVNIDEDKKNLASNNNNDNYGDD
jgi:carbonic anhydrase/acetyltransferase-like protein (isoleucine patch superfamily)